MTSEDIDKVVLVGGPTRIPIVQEYVELYLDKKVERGIDSMECVAQGAAIQAGVIDGVIGDLILVDVTLLSLGTEVADGSTSVIIPRNTVIPVKKSEIYSTVHDEDVVQITVKTKELKMQPLKLELVSTSFNIPLLMGVL